MAQQNLQLNNYKEAETSINCIEEIVSKSFLNQLSDIKVLPCVIKESDTRVFNISRLVYDKNESVYDKLSTVISSMSYAKCSIFFVINGFTDRTDFFIGVKSHDEERTVESISKTLKDALCGNFPGIKINTDEDNRERGSRWTYVNRRLEDYKADICSVSVVPSLKDRESEKNNENFIQGLEKFVLSMSGKSYTAVVVAKHLDDEYIDETKGLLEDSYTRLSSIVSQQMNFSINSSVTDTLSRSVSFSESTTNGLSFSNSEGETQSLSTTNGQTITNSYTDGVNSSISFGYSKGTSKSHSKTKNIHSSLKDKIVGSKSTQKSESENRSYNHQTGTSHSDSYSEACSTQISVSKGTNSSRTIGNSLSTTKQQSVTDSDSRALQNGSTQGFNITIENKKVKDLQDKINKQIERIDKYRNGGMWSVMTYFITDNTNSSMAETAASIFRGIMLGGESNLEQSSINVWKQKNASYENILNCVKNFEIPNFQFDDVDINGNDLSAVTSNELALLMGFPRKSVPGLPVIECAQFGKQVEVVDIVGNTNATNIILGKIYDHGEVNSTRKVLLNKDLLCSHVFVAGSTGSGKSVTVYTLLRALTKANTKFLVIEPAKGEYRHEFPDANIYGTLPDSDQILRINPFYFPEGIHVSEHAEKLVEILKVCWPMEAAMPDFLKSAIFDAYESCGWIIEENRNETGIRIFPNVYDLERSLTNALNNSKFQGEVKGNYEGALLTRVHSLANGINRLIFCEGNTSNAELFDDNCIVDLSRAGSSETKSLLMGMLVMRMNEYRMVSGSVNSELKHVTVLEEAHNILRRCSKEQSNMSANVAGKAVEMISNSIAEMRTYGEGFIIVDQSPNAVDVSAITNTNTKIIMKLPEENDINVAGKSISLSDDQMKEISKLPRGVAIVSQSNWLEPVLCKVDKIVDNGDFNEKKIINKNEFYRKKDIGFEIIQVLVDREYRTNKINVDSVNKLNICGLSKYILIEYFLSGLDKKSEGGLRDNDQINTTSSIISDILGFTTISRLVSKWIKQYGVRISEQEFNAIKEDFVKTTGFETENKAVITNTIFYISYYLRTVDSSCLKFFTSINTLTHK